MTILRSTGPVISTRRSCRSSGMRSDFPFTFPDRTGFGEKIRLFAVVDFGLNGTAAFEERLPTVFEFTGQNADELKCFRGQHPGKILGYGCMDLDAVDIESGFHMRGLFLSRGGMVDGCRFL